MDGCGEKSETRAESQPLNERDKSVGGWVEDKAIGRDTLRNRKDEVKRRVMLISLNGSVGCHIPPSKHQNSKCFLKI